MKTPVQSPASQDGELLDGGCKVSRIEEFPNIPENTKELNKREEYERDSEIVAKDDDNVNIKNLETIDTNDIASETNYVKYDLCHISCTGIDYLKRQNIILIYFMS